METNSIPLSELSEETLNNIKVFISQGFNFDEAFLMAIKEEERKEQEENALL